MTTLDRPGVLSLRRPLGEPAPIVLDSPHSGTAAPPDFATRVPAEALRTGVDAFVDELFPGPGHGAPMLAALFPRTYIDPNRSLEDLDPDLVEGEWPEPVSPGAKTAIGKGLIWTRCLDGSPIYARRLAPGEVRRRIEGYWRPYRQALGSLLDEAHARLGRVWHVNCHSMPSVWPPGVPGAGEPVAADFVLGDLDGTTCEPAFTALVRETLEGLGHRVAVNDRFKGVDIVRAHGDPAAGRHSLQIEVVRDRYLDEATGKRHAGFDAIRSALGTVLDRLAEHARASA